jgi:hypothetical protein
MHEILPRHSLTDTAVLAYTLSSILDSEKRKKMSLLITEDFLSQTGRATLGLAKLLLHFHKGDKLPRMADIAHQLKIGHGTVQEAFNSLTRSGAITVEARGAQGSRLLAIDYILLWHYAGNEWIIGSMPLPYTLRYEGLATALYAQLETSDIPFNMTYQRGSILRGEMVRKGHYHYAVMSLLAAEAFVRDHPEMTIVKQFTPTSYVTEHVLISTLPREQIQRIGVDFTSLDELLLTQEESQLHSHWQNIPVTRAQVLELLLEDTFDAIIWNRDGIQVIPPHVQLLPLLGDAQKRKAATQAAIIALQDAPIYNVLLSIFSSDEITTIQDNVVGKQRLPRY